MEFCNYLMFITQKEKRKKEKKNAKQKSKIQTIIMIK